jgi:hypothetical protein
LTVVTNSSANNQAINMGLNIQAGNKTFSTLGGTTLTLGGTITGNATGTQGLVMNRGGTTGTAIFVLSGNNSYTGRTAMGTNTELRITHQNSLGTSELFTNNNAWLDNTSGAALTIGNDILLNNSLRFLGSNDLTTTGTVTTNNNAVNRSINVAARKLTVGKLDAVNTTDTMQALGGGILAIVPNTASIAVWGAGPGQQRQLAARHTGPGAPDRPHQLVGLRRDRSRVGLHLAGGAFVPGHSPSTVRAPVQTPGRQDVSAASARSAPAVPAR